MRIVSINAALTIDSRQITFNVDEELSPEFIDKIEYGSLKFKGEGKTLTVQLPPHSEAFSSNSVSTLNEKLQRISNEYSREAMKRKSMLDGIAEDTGLPLD